MNIFFERIPAGALRAAAFPFSANLRKEWRFTRSPPIPLRPEWNGLDRIKPHKQYTARLDVLLQSGFEAAHSLIGWRFIEWSQADDTRLGARLVAARTDEGEEDVDDVTYEFIGFNIGRFVEASLTGLVVAEQEPGGDYYYRFLMLPQIHLAAIWLEPRDSSGDPALILPLPPFPPELQGQTYPVGRLFNLLQERMHESIRKTPPGTDDEEGDGNHPVNLRNG